MKKTLVACATLILCVSHCFSQPCVETQIDSAKSAVAVLKSLNPNETDAAARHCISASIEAISFFKDGIGVPELIRYLTFHRIVPPEEANGIILHVPFEGYEYPAITALSRIGEPARPGLLNVIESDRASEMERQNAAHALVLSFVRDGSEDPGQGIRYIRAAERSVDTPSKRRLEEAIAYILKTPACSRFAPKCTKADQESSSP